MLRLYTKILILIENVKKSTTLFPSSITVLSIKNKTFGNIVIHTKSVIKTAA